MRKICCLTGLVVLFWAIQAGLATAKTYWVAKDGLDTNSGTEASPWLTVQKGLDEIVAGDTLTIEAGTYTERPIVRTSGSSGKIITIKAKSGDTVVIDGTGSGISQGNGLLDASNKDFLKFDGLRFTDSPGYGVKFVNADNIVFQNCEVDNSQAGGLVFEVRGSSITIDNNDIHHNNLGGGSSFHEAVTLVNVDGFTVKNNVFHNNIKEGFDAKQGSKNGEVFDNVARDNTKVGLYIDTATDIDVYNNECYNNGTQGITLGLEFSTPRTARIRVWNNVIYGNGDGGIALFSEESNGIIDSHIVNNTIVDNDDAGIWWMSTTHHDNITIRNNWLTGNGPSTGRRELREAVASTIDDETVENNCFDSTHNSDWEGTAALEQDPIFVNPATNDYHLEETSPGIGHGVNPGSFRTADKDGNPIQVPASPTCGAYEVVSGGGGACNGDINEDGRIDIADLQMLVNIILGVEPGENCADLNNDGLVNVIDLQALINQILKE